MASTPAGVHGAGEVVSVRRIPAAAADTAAAGGELQRRERTLNRFVRAVAFWEWAGNAFGALAFLWATGVLLGGFCSNLDPPDFWLATVIIFIEAFRIFSGNYKSDNQWLFGTTRALRWINVSFARILGRPQEGNEVVLIMCMSIELVTWLPVVGVMFTGILQVGLLIVMSKMQLRGASQQTSRSQRLLQLWAVLIAFIILYALGVSRATNDLYPRVILYYYGPAGADHRYDYTDTFWTASLSAEMLSMVVAALLLISRPPIVSNLTNTPWGRCLLFLAKLISAISLAFGSVVIVRHCAFKIGDQDVDPSSFIISFATLVLSLGSLQAPTAENCSLVIGGWIDVTLHMLFLWYLVIGIPVLFTNVWIVQIPPIASIVSVVAVLLIENLQIPAAVLQVMLSSSRIHKLDSDYSLSLHDKESNSPNMVPAIEVFYVLSICQGCFYIMASILGLFSFFPRRMLVRQSKLRGQQGAKAIDLYYESTYSTCMETGLFAARKTLSLASFAKESLSSNSSETQLAGVLLLDNLMHESRGTDSIEEMRSKIIRSNKTLSTLIAMLGWADERHRDIRLTAARIIANLADNITVADTPGTLKVVCSLLDDDHQPDTLPDAVANHQQPDQETLGQTTFANGENAGSEPTDEELGLAHDNNLQRVVTSNQQPDQETSGQTTSANGENAGSQPTDEELGHPQDNNGGCIWVCVCQCWQWMKDKWSNLEELPLTHQDSLPILGMAILEKLAHDPDNCSEIARAKYLISKILGLISYRTDNESSNSNYEQQRAVICASLNFVRRFASTGENIGATLRQELCNNSFLLNNLECVLEDSRSSPELIKLVFNILTKLAFDEDARKELGSCKMIVWKLMYVFIGKDGPTNAYYDQSLRIAAGEALANLTIESPANCLFVLEEPGFELIKDLKNMLCEDEYRYIAASILQNICEHTKDKVGGYQDARNYLSSAFPKVMENIISAEGKHLEVLIGLISQISDMIPETCIHDQLQLQTDQSELVQKLVGTLDSNRKPNPEYPRMRRVIIEMAISIVKVCPAYAAILKEGWMIEALSKVEMTPSKVEKHKVFYGNIGVVLESGPSLTALAATAKGLIHSAAPTSALQTTMLG